MSGIAPGAFLILFGRPVRTESGRWQCPECGSKWALGKTRDQLRSGEPCRWCERSAHSAKATVGMVRP